MEPMGLFSTPFLSYHDIRVEDIELIEDAWGMKSEFLDVITFLGQVKTDPDPSVTLKLIAKIRDQK
jgi:hypothetical protein